MKQLLGIFILAVLSLFFAAPFSYAQSKAPAGSTESSSGQAVNLTAKAAVLIEGNSGEIILEKNKDTELVPASITKIMTLTLIMEALEEGKIQLTDSVSVSEYAASMGGSQVFLEPNETQTVDTMIKCISIASANDAAVAMAEKIAGSEPNFVKKMNEKAKELGCPIMAKVVSVATTGVEPELMGIGPISSTKKALEKAGLTVDDIDLFEINEAFSSQCLACQKELGVPDEKLNVNGGGISLGHPVGATGSRIVITLMYELKRRKQRYGVATLCADGGMGTTVVIEMCE